jgi:hypothetical protein
MQLEKIGKPSDLERKYILKNQKAQVELVSVRRSSGNCDPLAIKVDLNKPIYPVEKAVTLLTERLRVKR